MTEVKRISRKQSDLNYFQPPGRITTDEFKSILEAVKQSNEFQECLHKIDLPKLQGLKDTSE